MQEEIFFQLFLASFLGAIIGFEREYKKKQAGLQTYSLVALGSCLFTLLAFEFFNNFFIKTGISFDPSRIIQAVAIGVGFIGAGIIFQKEDKVEGLTTAAGLWATAAIAIAVGTKFYLPAVFATFLALLILVGLGELEKRFLK